MFPPSVVDVGSVLTPERMPDGRFATGHAYFGPSDLQSLQVTKRRAILKATTVEDALEVIAAMKQAALDGNTQAAAVYLAYAVGKPESIDPKQAGQTFDVQNLNKPASDLSPEQRRARLAYLLAEQAREAK